MLNNRKVVAVSLFVGLVYCLIEGQGTGDLLIYLAAAGDLGRHVDIFAKAYWEYHYYYSVLFAICLKPFYHLPFYGVKCCWLVLNLSLFAHLVMLLARTPQLQVLTTRQRNFLMAVALLFSLRFVHENIHASQITILILWCCIYGLRLVMQNRPVAGALILAAGINIKLMPIVILPYLLYRGHFKACALTVLFYLLSLALPSVIIGHDYNTQLLGSWFKLVNPMNTQHIMDVDERSFHGLTTLLTTLFIEHPPDPLAMTLKRNIADVSLATLSLIILGVRLFLVTLTLYFLKPRTLFRRTGSPAVEISYILLVIPLIFPHQQHYAFLFAAPAFVTVMYYAVVGYGATQPGNRRLLATMLCVVYLCCNLKILLGEYNRYYEHYKVLTYGVLLLIPLLVWANRQRHKLLMRVT